MNTTQKNITLNQFLELPKKEIKRVISTQNFFRGDFEWIKNIMKY